MTECSAIIVANDVSASILNNRTRRYGSKGLATVR